VADIAQAHALLHGEEKEVFADAGYPGVEKREEIAPISEEIEWHVASKRGKIKAMAEGLVKEVSLLYEKAKAQVRALVEHPYPANLEILRANVFVQRFPRVSVGQIDDLQHNASLEPEVGRIARGLRVVRPAAHDPATGTEISAGIPSVVVFGRGRGKRDLGERLAIRVIAEAKPVVLAARFVPADSDDRQ
jgi:hypothetical protein